MPERVYNVLFLCTGNSARSVMAEAILNKTGRGKFRAYSAGSQPKGQVNPHTLQLLAKLGYDTSSYRSKSWEEFARPGAPKLDFVFTVCDDAAGEAARCTRPADDAHWGIRPGRRERNVRADRAGVQQCYRMLSRRTTFCTACRSITRPAGAVSARHRKLPRGRA
jgi:arsenate reductase